MRPTSGLPASWRLWPRTAPPAGASVSALRAPNAAMVAGYAAELVGKDALATERTGIASTIAFEIRAKRV